MDRSVQIFTGVGVHRGLRLLLGLVTICFLAGCGAVGPDYVRPDMPVPDAWHQNADSMQAEGSNDHGLATWWQTLNDPVLDTLMDRAVKNNLDLHSALSSVRQARIRRGISGADLYPSVNASGSAGRTYQNDIHGDFSSTDTFSTGLDASWELDIFGGVRRTLEASDAQIQVSEDSYRDVLVSLLAEVATDYVQLRSYQSRLSVAEANLASQEETLKITRWRYQAGLTTQLDVQKAKSNLEQTRSSIPSLHSDIKQTLNALSVLLGGFPGTLDTELSTYRPIPTPPDKITVGIPADLLRRRPDLRKAERELEAQTAQIGVAKAKLYPSLSLSGSIGLDALSAGDLLDSDSLHAGTNALISWPVYKAGAIMRNVKLQYELQEQNLIAYRKALLVALKDVENGLTSYAYEKDSRASLLAAYQAAEQAAKISKDQYASGLVDFTTVLDSERTLLTLQDQLTQSDARIIEDIVTIYKAVGGGWDSSHTEGS